MDFYNADLHIHSPHSIAVSKSLNLDTMVQTALKKGLQIIGTGDILQPEWQQYMKAHLNMNADMTYSYKKIFFILQSELEDIDSIHHVALFPNFTSIQEISKKLQPHSKNINSEWGGRPRVNLTAPELAEICIDAGAVIGPAHAFTPFKSIFRQNKYKDLEDCYRDYANKIFFIELGLSANTDLADRLECLKDISFLSNSDAHSENPRSLGREFNKFEIDSPSFEEILLALTRKSDRRISLNVGLHPKLGKYYTMFCNKCRRRIIFKKSNKISTSILNQINITKDFITFYSENPSQLKQDFISQVSNNKVDCPACQEKLKKNYKIKLGVSERIDVISTYVKPNHPPHRPRYINAIPLIDIIKAVKNIKSPNSKMVLKLYDSLINHLGTEFEILIDVPLAQLEKFDLNLSSIISAMRNDEIDYTPGGGGIYGQLKIELE
jgi:uncharacterized protein (TIGR00375 family)